MAIPGKEAMLTMIEALRKAQEDGTLYENIARNNPLFEMLKTKAEEEKSLAAYKARIDKELAERMLKRTAEADKAKADLGQQKYKMQALYGARSADYSKMAQGIMGNIGGAIGAGLAQRNVEDRLVERDYVGNTWTEIWQTELDWRTSQMVRQGTGRISIGYFDAWAKNEAQRKGLALLGTDQFATEFSVNKDAVVMRARVLLTKWEPERQGAQGIVPYIDEVTIGTVNTFTRADGTTGTTYTEEAPAPTKTSRFAELDFEEYPKGGKK